MRDQSVYGEAMQKWRLAGRSISSGEAAVLKELAKEVAEAAARPEQDEKASLWLRHNKLERTRPPILCDPENGWNEIIGEEKLKCGGELARSWENRLRRELFWANRMGDDRVTDANFYVYYAYGDTGWGANETMHKTEDTGSYAWEGGLPDYALLDTLHYPEITVDYDATNELLETAESVFGGILNVELRGQWWWSLNITNVLVNLRGLEQSMMDVYDYPDELHKLMAFIRDGFMHKLDFFEANNLLSLNNGNIYAGSGGYGFTDELPAGGYDGRARTVDMWGFCESQETTSVSPEMFEEFVYAYQKPLMDRFTLNCYGCCEPLERRWDIIKNSHGLRRVSVSPWADPHKMAGYLGKDFIFSYKPNPAYLAVEHIDEDAIRAQLREIISIAKDCRLEIIMKDNHTIGKNPQNVIDWCRIAKEEAERV